MGNKSNTRKFITIPLWINEYLGLNGNELILFSYIYGFSQDDCSYCYSGITEITNTMHISRRNVFNLINSLLEKGLIIKEETEVYGKTMIGYRYNKEAVELKQREYYSDCTDGEKIALEEVKRLRSANEKIAPNNKYDNKYIYKISSSNSNSSNNLTSTNSCKNKEEIEEIHISESNDSSICPKKPHSKRFVKPTLEELSCYISENRYNVDPNKFLDYYDSCGWVVGKNKPMKDWKATVRTWSRNAKGDETYIERHNPSIYRTFGPDDEIPF